MKMKIIIPILMLLVLMGIVSAATVVTQDPTGVLANATFQTDSSIDYGIIVTGNQTSWMCYLYTNENESSGSGTYEAKVTGMVVANNTNVTFPTRTSVADATGTTAYNWSVKCNATTDPIGDWTTSGGATGSNFTYGVDITAPVVSINGATPEASEWITSSGPTFGLTVNDSNADDCILKTTLNTSSNSTQAYGAYPTIAQSYTTATAFNFTGYGPNKLGMGDNNTNAYYWSYWCNDSAGNTVSNSNVTFWIDTTAPSAFDVTTTALRFGYRRLWYNATTTTDYTPQFGWTATTDLNFSRYELNFFKFALGNITGHIQLNTTGRITGNKTNISTLAGDTKYYILVTAYDLAGNSNNITTSGYSYSTDSTNRDLDSGWNIIGNIGEDATLSALLNRSGGSTVSYWNTTHQFQSHVAGGSYSTTTVPAGAPFFVYMSADGTFSDMRWNSTAHGGISAFNITNSSNSMWNLMVNFNSTDDYTLEQIDYYLNANSSKATSGDIRTASQNVTYLSYYNNTATIGSKYTSYVSNWTINNGTKITYGDAVWAFLGTDSNDKTLMNWYAI